MNRIDPFGATTTRLLLVRHGQSTWNAEGRWQGQADPPLSPLGRRQAGTAAERIGGVDVIVTSPQIRAAHTAAIIGEALGVGPVVTIDGLRERHAGAWSGLTHVEIDERYPGFLDDGRRPDDYEDDHSLTVRTAAALEAIVETWPGAAVLVVTHGGVIHNLETSLGLSAGRVPNLSGREFVHTRDRLHAGELIFLADAHQRSGGSDGRL